MTDTPTTDLPVANERMTEVKLAEGDICIVFREATDGLQAAVFDNMEQNKPSVLIPLVRGVIASLNEAGGADLLIKKGIDAIVGNQAVN